MRLAVIISLILIGCTKQENTIHEITLKEDKRLAQSQVELQKREEIIIKGGKEVSGIFYTCNSISGKEFLARRNEKIEESDLNEIEKEQVFILELTIPEQHNKILDSPKIQFDSEELVKYLSGEVIKDFEIVQNDKIFLPNAAIYEGMNGNGNSLRIYFLMKNIDLNKMLVIRFYDRIFGSGFIRLTKNDTINLSI